jgi:hypothetical protein
MKFFHTWYVFKGLKIPVDKIQNNWKTYSVTSKLRIVKREILPKSRILAGLSHLTPSFDELLLKTCKWQILVHTDQ